jgi:hypothetical protein
MVGPSDNTFAVDAGIHVVTTPDPSAELQDPETPESVLTRFGITTLDENFTEFTVVASMPVGRLVNPFTGMPTVGPLAILVDDVGGRANFYRRGSGQWTVSSELTVELSPDGIDSLQAAPDEPVVASSRRAATHRSRAKRGEQWARVRHVPPGAASGFDHQQPDRDRARRSEQRRTGTRGLCGDQPWASCTVAHRVDPGQLPATVLRWFPIPLRRNGIASRPEFRHRGFAGRRRRRQGIDSRARHRIPVSLVAGEVERARAATELAVAAVTDHGFDSAQADYAVTVAKVVLGRVVPAVVTAAHQLCTVDRRVR